MPNKMKLRYKILIAIGSGLVVLIAAYVGLTLFLIHEISRASTPYEPDCAGDSACVAWTEFRTKHPYPYQELAAKRLTDATLALIISEPSLPKGDLDQLVKAVFGADLIASKRRRWTLLTDGWLEDLVLTVRVGNVTLGPNIDDPIFRDRIAILYDELFGTTYGGSVDFFADSASPSLIGTPNLGVSPAELRTWATESNLEWRSLDDQWSDQLNSWRELAAQRVSGAFGSSDGSLVILTFPTNVLLSARSQPRTLDSLRTPFRMFAVASDCVLGGLWTVNDQLAIIARARQRSLTEVPPLRFETFELLATQYADELSQSYERNAIFAGKLDSGEYAFKDWAPVYLSEALIDTEFGALLNTTDQLLKSWSEAGTVEYQYFNYPKPGQYPFGAKPLSDLLGKETGSKSVTFNWNTAGFGVVVARPDLSVLATKQVGSLPVTYLAGKQDDHIREVVLKHEDAAYDYFSARCDSNLERVVQYTTLYQLFRAIEKGAASSNSLNVHQSTTVSSRAAATRVLADETAQLLDDLQAGKLTKGPRPYLNDLQSKITAFQAVHPEITNLKLARIVANRLSQEAEQYAKNRRRTLQSQRANLDSDLARFNQDVEAYNVRAKSVTFAVDTADLLTAKEALERRHNELDNRSQALDKEFLEDPIDDIREKTARVASAERDLDAIRKHYLQEVPKTSATSIKTPSIVLSWAGKDVLVSVGGHNLDAHTLKLEMTPVVSGVELKQTDNGYVLRYNPSKADVAEANATAIAHAVEHDRIEAPAEVENILNKGGEIRSRTAALQLPAADAGGTQSERWSGQLGSRAYTGKDAFVEDLRTVANKNDCCVFVAQDDHGVSYVTERNASPPPTIITMEVRDTPSLRDYVKHVSTRAGTKNEKAIVFLDSNEAHVQALTLGLRNSDQSGAALEFDRAVSESHRINSNARTDALVQRDLRGRPSFIERLSDLVGDRGRDLLEHLGIIQPKEVWEQVQVIHLDEDSTRGFLQELHWEPTRDGVPTAIKVSFGSGGGGNSPPDLSVIAGFDEGDSSLGNARLQSAHRENVAAASTNGASLAQYVMGVKNDLGSLTDIQLKRLVVVVQDKQETKIFLSRLEGDNGPPSGF